MSKDTLLRWCLAVASVLITLLLLEAGLRVYAHMRQRASEVAWQNLGVARVPPVQRGNVTMRQLIRPNTNPKVIYELVPNQSVQFRDQHVTVNALGFRGPPVEPVKPLDTKRIVGLGDSLMFGWGVGDAEYYLALIAERLARQAPHPVEIINSAVPGYNTVMEVETLKEKLLPFAPDVVIIEYVDNDLDLPNFLDQPLSPLTVEHLFLHDWVTARLAGRVWDPAHRLAGAPRDPFGDGNRLESNPERVPTQYRALVGIEAYRAAMSELKALSVAQRFAVVVFSRAPFPDDIAAVCDALGLPMVSAWPALERYLSEHGGGRYEESALAVSANDPHPSALGHRLMAEVLIDYLERAGLP